eukprot:TRINITY_DN27964_c0_g1_i1.p1 TRINITY_DN27964_c0_g1~~TRINITY_DN27964_c0_g1_i1.p1  ORF type:complete len:243 (+),score=34.53 TRINITY_DN27964_c0_g1_i1:107-730(+)
MSKKFEAGEETAIRSGDVPKYESLRKTPPISSKYSSLTIPPSNDEENVDIERGRDYNVEFDRESKKFTGKGSLRYLFGYDFTTRNYLGTERMVEKHRAESLNRVIESPDFYESEMYASFYTNSLKLNNQCYKTIYQYFFVFLSLTFGVLLSVTLGVLTAVVEFFIQFIVRPMLKMTRMIVEIFVLLMHMLADVIRPIASLWLPWNKN